MLAQSKTILNLITSEQAYLANGPPALQNLQEFMKYFRVSLGRLITR